MTRILVEACVETAAQARAAVAAGADRVELCSRLDLGGLTPSMAEIAAARQVVEVPLHALVRPRPGDFIYSADELGQMIDEIGRAKAAGADGVVIGAITAAGQVDTAAVRQLIAAARPSSVTFHRAFDEVWDQHQALELLVALGVERVLTAGAAPTALEGAARLRELVAAARNRIIILAGGSVRPHNVSDLVRRTGAIEVHARMDDDPGRAGEMRKALGR